MCVGVGVGVHVRTKSSLGLRWNAPSANGSAIVEYCLEWDQSRGLLSTFPSLPHGLHFPPLLKVSLCSCSLEKGSNSSSATSFSQAAKPSSVCELVMPLAGVRPVRRQCTVWARLHQQLRPLPPSPPAPLTPSLSTGLCLLARLLSHLSAWKWMTLTQ